MISACFPGRIGDAAGLVFEYMAATQAETGRPVPVGPHELPAALRAEHRDLPAFYRAPGTLLIADGDGEPVGCVGLAAHPPSGTGLPAGTGLPVSTAEVKRLYVRPSHRGRGIAGALMRYAHRHAARQGLTELVLDVLPARTVVISWYQRLGYSEIASVAPASLALAAEDGMIRMRRPVTTADSIVRA